VGDPRYLEGLTQLHRLGDAETLRSVWRQSMATLASQAADLRPAPLEGLDPSALAASMQVALSSGLLDTLDWLSPAHAGAALYELASALPVGDARRELGRRVLQSLHEGDAETFVAIATRLARTSRKALAGPGLRARVALALRLPARTLASSDRLALALISHPAIERDWLAVPSEGSLASRRLAARLLERAAREALRATRSGDLGTLRVFEQPSVLDSFQRLLADREPLVWRHVAVARGLLSLSVQRFGHELVHEVDPALTPTQWRRAATSLAASIAIDSARGLRLCNELLASDVFRKDPGIASTMVLGLPRAAEVEPAAAEQLLTKLVQVGMFDTMEALLELQHERLVGPFGARAFEIAIARLRELSNSSDDGRVALSELMSAELSADGAPRSNLRRALGEALQLFATQGARAAHAKATGIADAVLALIERLEACDTSSSQGRRDAYKMLRELDLALLRTSQLTDLLAIGSSDSLALKKLRSAFQRLMDWLIDQEVRPVVAGEPLEHPTFRLHRLRTLLHVVDADVGMGEDPPPTLRERRFRTVRLLLSRASNDAPSPLRRVVCAAAARACDALLREEIAELSDVLIDVASEIRAATDLVTMAEASMDHEASTVLRAYARMVQTTEEAAGQAARVARAQALRELGAAFPLIGSPRVEALRVALLGYADAVQAVQDARSLTELVATEGASLSRLGALADAARQLALLVLGARRRMGAAVPEAPRACGTAVRTVELALDHTLRGHAGLLEETLPDAIATLHQELPGEIAEVAIRALTAASKRPVSTPESGAEMAATVRAAREVPLPVWLPPSRTLGGFYVLRPLGAGAVGSVFMACRVEDRHRKAFARFALKVPEYGGDVARTLSEKQFMQMFREEAGTLLALPQHPNLGRLITFDAGAVPKPILVMELVDGPGLDRLIEGRRLDMRAALAVLDGVCAGLEVLHDAGVGHLDLKPPNVILRESSDQGPLSVDLSSLHGMALPGQQQPEAAAPVLVDFGLAGRKLRPGCATAAYGAPEIWGPPEEMAGLRPMAADVYAFGCLAWELLTGQELFRAPTQMAVLLAHLMHDGGPEPLLAACRKPGLARFGELLRHTLRKDPALRMPIARVRQELQSVAADLLQFPWPIPYEAL
jgi:eukaryotic-like serine/threonine-protein kinase